MRNGRPPSRVFALILERAEPHGAARTENRTFLASTNSSKRIEPLV
jgi:hypothetical protein